MSTFGPPPQGPPRTPITFTGIGATYDDFQPARSKRHPVLVALSLICLVTGGIMLAYGIVEVVDQTGQIRSDAVARSTVALPGEDPVVAQFVSGKARAYTVYVDIGTGSDTFRESIVADTTCVARFADGDTATMRGDRQSISNTVGDLSSIGFFDAPEGQVAVACKQSSGSRAGRVLRFFVTPGTTNLFGGVGWILAGAGLLAASLVFAIFGLRRTYQTTTIAA